MKAFKNSNTFDGGQGSGGGLGAGIFHGLGGGSGSGSQGPGYGGGGSSSGFQGNQGNQGRYHQQPGQGNQQQQSGYQSNPKQLNSGQYHVFTTSLCKRDQKLHKRAVNAVDPAVPRYLRWSEQPIVWSQQLLGGLSDFRIRQLNVTMALRMVYITSIFTH